METDKTLRLLEAIMLIFPADADDTAFEAKTTVEEAQGFLEEWAAKEVLWRMENGKYDVHRMQSLEAEYARLAPPTQPTRGSREIFELAIRSVASRINLLQQLCLGKTIECGEGVLTPEHKPELLARIQADIRVLSTAAWTTDPLLQRMRILLKLAMQETCTDEEISQLIFTMSKKTDD